MDTVKYDLGGVEKNLLGFREKNRIIDPKQQSVQYFTTLSELDKEITKQGVQLQVVDNLIAYITDTRNPYRQVGSTLGIEEPSLAFPDRGIQQATGGAGNPFKNHHPVQPDGGEPGNFH